MKKWLQYIFRGPTLVALVLAAVVTGVAVRFAPEGGSPGGAVFYETGGALEPAEGANVTTVEVGRHGTASVHHLRVAESVPAHVHRNHDEQVVVLAGEGELTLGEEKRTVSRGTVVVVPRGTVHALTVTGEPVEAVSVFSPPFDGEDRHLVE